MRFFASLIVSLFMLLAAAYPFACDIPGDLITSLPGYPNGGKTPSKQYSGYIQVATTRYLHYWLVLSEHDPTTDPLILWMNGGPGCSSLDGFFYEQGPVRFTGASGPDDIPLLMDNPNRWNLFSSVVFLEAPAGVGYSYSTDPTWSPSDNTTADDNFAFVQGFFQGFTELATNEFFITGESYAGVYVPMLADLIRIGNARGDTKINLKGFAAGNGCNGNAVGSCGGDGQATQIEVENYHDHMLFSPALYESILSNCTDWNNPSLECDILVSNAFSEAGSFNVYDIYDECEYGDAEPNNTLVGHRQAKRTSARYTKYARAPPSGMAAKALLTPKPMVDHACQDVDAATYLNPQSVRTALHAQPESVTGSFALCTNIDYQQNVPSLLPGYPQLIAAFRVLIYSGDSDACVPFFGSYLWTSGLGYPIESEWQPWQVDLQVGGYYTSYKVPNNSEFVFLTVKGSGHMVPQYRPVEAFAFMQSFVSGTSMKHTMSPKVYKQKFMKQ